MLTFIFASVASITSHLSLRLRRCGKIIIFWWFDNRMFLWSLPNLSVSLRHSWGHCGTHMNPANMNALMNIRKELVVFPIFPRKDTFSDDFGLILNNFFITSLQLGEGRSQISEEYYNEYLISQPLRNMNTRLLMFQSSTMWRKGVDWWWDDDPA